MNFNTNNNKYSKNNYFDNSHPQFSNYQFINQLRGIENNNNYINYNLNSNYNFPQNPPFQIQPDLYQRNYNIPNEESIIEINELSTDEKTKFSNNLKDIGKSVGIKASEDQSDFINQGENLDDYDKLKKLLKNNEKMKKDLEKIYTS